MKLDWRTIESHVIDILRRDGIEVSENTKSGDKYAINYQFEEYNITEFARSLATRLMVKP